MQVVTSGLPAFLIDTSVNMDYPKTPINVNLRNWAKEYLSAITRIYFSLVDCPNNINKYSNIEGCL